MHDTIRLLEEENNKLRLQLDFAIDMIVLNHDCVLCPMSSECEYEFAPHDADRFAICRNNMEKLFEKIIPQDVE